jgi:hypothetical protein
MTTIAIAIATVIAMMKIIAIATAAMTIAIAATAANAWSLNAPLAANPFISTNAISKKSTSLNALPAARFSPSLKPMLTTIAIANAAAAKTLNNQGF